jgi:YD repeat-containing protein
MNLRSLTRRTFRLACLMTGAAIGVLMVTLNSARAQEATTYSYDALGRLVSSSTTGGPNNGVATGTCFDAAGNRTQYVVGGAGAPCTTAPNSMFAPTDLQASTPAQSNAAPLTAPDTPPSAPLTQR